MSLTYFGIGFVLLIVILYNTIKILQGLKDLPHVEVPVVEEHLLEVVAAHDLRQALKGHDHILFGRDPGNQVAREFAIKPRRINTLLCTARLWEHLQHWRECITP